MVSEVEDALICAPFRVNHTVQSCHLCIGPLTKLHCCTVFFVMLYTAMFLLQAVCFEAEGNKMKATPEAMIKVRALMLKHNVGGNVVVKEEHLLCSCQRSEMQVVLCKPQDEG